ncbi:hypothetical protein CBS101457_000089 [Exobasidium rhododendri]|nr:hypothetical protein CBS101457_000089 [Exobasidium rhododendri]
MTHSSHTVLSMLFLCFYCFRVVTSVPTPVPAPGPMHNHKAKEVVQIDSSSASSSEGASPRIKKVYVGLRPRSDGTRDFLSTFGSSSVGQDIHDVQGRDRAAFAYSYQNTEAHAAHHRQDTTHEIMAHQYPGQSTVPHTMHPPQHHLPIDTQGTALYPVHHSSPLHQQAGPSAQQQHGVQPVLHDDAQKAEVDATDAFQDYMHSRLAAIATQASSYFASSADGMDPTRVQPEYMIRFDPSFSFDNEIDSVFYKLDKLQRMIVIDRVSQIRPYRIDSIRKALQRKMSAPVARALLSGDVAEVEAGVECIYPIERKKKGFMQPPWMFGLDNAQRRQVIALLANATQQSTDDLRELFLTRKIEPFVSWQILSAPSLHQLVHLAYTHGLIIAGERRKCLTWQRGLSVLQRKAVIQRMMGSGIVRKQYCYELFQRPFIPAGFGLVMLRVNEEAFQQIMAILKGKE